MKINERTNLKNWNKAKRLLECDIHNFSGDEGAPSGDGVPSGHNRPGLNGEDTQATQGQGRGMSNNSKLFNENFCKEVYKKSRKLKEDMPFEYDEDDVLSFVEKYLMAHWIPEDVYDLTCEQFDDLVIFFDEGNSIYSSLDEMIEDTMQRIGYPEE